MKTRAILALSALLAGGLSVSVANAAVKKPKPKPIPACAKFADAAGDAFFADSDPVNQPKDDTLDITGVTYSVSGGVLSVKIAIPKYSSSHTLSDGDRFDANFTLGGKAINIFSNDGNGWKVLEPATFAKQGIKVDAKYVSGSNKLVTRTTGTVVTISVKLADLATVAGIKADGAQISGLQAVSFGEYDAFADPFDTADAPATLKPTLVTCK